MKRAHPDSSCVDAMDSQHDLFSLGQNLNLGIKTSEPCIQFVYSNQDSISSILLSLNLKQLDQLVKYIPLLKTSLNKRPDTIKTISEYETLIRQQTQFLIGNNVYVTVNHFQDGSQLQFIEYMVVSSLSVPGQSVVCPSRLCMVLDKSQLQELSSKMCLIKSAIKNAKKKKPSKKLCDYPDYATCLLTSSQKRCETEVKDEDFDGVI